MFEEDEFEEEEFEEEEYEKEVEKAEELFYRVSEFVSDLAIEAERLAKKHKLPYIWAVYGVRMLLEDLEKDLKRARASGRRLLRGL